MYKDLIKKINEFDKICIYRHLRPDGDAVFSQFALYEFLKLNFKNKKIEAMGFDEYDLFPYSNTTISDNFIKDSLSIVVDTANEKRVDDSRFLNAQYIIKIDHHPPVENYGNINIVKDDACATCELLAEIFLSKEFSKFKFNNDIYKYLYCGILTDSNSFRTSSTTSNTLLIASKLAQLGNLDIAALSNYVFNINFDYFNQITKLRTLLKVKDGVGYVIANQDTLDSIDMTLDSIKNAINTFGSIKGLKIWGIYAYNNKTKLYDGSIRSIRKYVINDVCAKYNGGGHKNACGVKSLSKAKVNLLIKELVLIAKN